MRVYLSSFVLAVGLPFLAAVFIGCSPEVGSDSWCKKLKETPKGDWSANDASAYAKNCIFR